MTSKKHIKLGLITAGISFLIGTIIFGSYYQTSDDGFLFLGYAYIALAGIINIGILIQILILSKEDKENRYKLLITSGIMLLNIPILIAYCSVAIQLLNTMRITVINDTGVELTDINIGSEHIEKLKIGESKMVWIPIKGDGSISILYLMDGHQRFEQVVGYTTHNMGGIMTYKIDKDL